MHVQRTRGQSAKYHHTNAVEIRKTCQISGWSVSTLPNLNYADCVLQRSDCHTQNPSAVLATPQAVFGAPNTGIKTHAVFKGQALVAQIGLERGTFDPVVAGSSPAEGQPSAVVQWSRRWAFTPRTGVQIPAADFYARVPLRRACGAART